MDGLHFFKKEKKKGEGAFSLLWGSSEIWRSSPPVGEPECLGYPREEKKGAGQHQRDALDGYTFQEMKQARAGEEWKIIGQDMAWNSFSRK